MLKDPVAKENLMLQQTHIQNLCVLDHFTSDASVFWYSFTWTRARLLIEVWFDTQFPTWTCFFIPEPALHKKLHTIKTAGGGINM